MKLELAVEKTHVTHVNDGFNFLGFQVRRYLSGHDRPKLLVTPSAKAQQCLKAKIKETRLGRLVVLQADRACAYREGLRYATPAEVAGDRFLLAYLS